MNNVYISQMKFLYLKYVPLSNKIVVFCRPRVLTALCPVGLVACRFPVLSALCLSASCPDGFMSCRPRGLSVSCPVGLVSVGLVSCRLSASCLSVWCPSTANRISEFSLAFKITAARGARGNTPTSPCIDAMYIES